jgi:hypothetical protein
MASGEGADFLLATVAVLVLFLAVAAAAVAARAGGGPAAPRCAGGRGLSGPGSGPGSDPGPSSGTDSDSEMDSETDFESDSEPDSDLGPGPGCSGAGTGAGAPGAGGRAAFALCADPDSDADSDADSEADADAGPLGRPRGLVSESDRFGAPAPAAEGRTRRLAVRLPPVAWRPPAGAAEFHGPDGPGVAPGFTPHPALPDHDEPE